MLVFNGNFKVIFLVGIIGIEEFGDYGYEMVNGRVVC